MVAAPSPAAPAPAQSAPRRKKSTGYGLWLEEHRAAIVKEIGTNSVLKVAAAAYEKWRAVPEGDKASYEQRAQELNAAILPASPPKPAAEAANVSAPSPGVAGAVGASATTASPASPASKGSPKGSEDDGPLAAAPKAAKVASSKGEKADKAKLEKKRSSKENQVGGGEPPEKKARPASAGRKAGTNEKLTVAWREKVTKAVQKYIEEHPKDWTLSMMVEELSEKNEEWENDEPLKMAVKMAIKAMGFTGLSAACPMFAKAWY